MGTACYVWIGLKTTPLSVLELAITIEMHKPLCIRLSIQPELWRLLFHQAILISYSSRRSTTNVAYVFAWCIQTCNSPYQTSLSPGDSLQIRRFPFRPITFLVLWNAVVMPVSSTWVTQLGQCFMVNVSRFKILKKKRNPGRSHEFMQQR